MMASPLALRGPQCISCTRKIASNLENAFQWPGRQQLRGMKKDAKVATTKVLLLQDITRYGPKGMKSVLQVCCSAEMNRKHCLGTVWDYEESLVS